MHACKGCSVSRSHESLSASGSDDTRLSTTNGRHATTFPSLLERKLSKPMFPHWNLTSINCIRRPTGPAWVPDAALLLNYDIARLGPRRATLTARCQAFICSAVKSTYVAVWSSQHVILLPNFGEDVVSAQDEEGNVVKQTCESLPV